MLDTLPSEIVLRICQFIDTSQSLKALRLTCRNTKDEPVEMLFETIYLGRYLYSVNNLKSISGTAHLAKHVKCIVCCPREIQKSLTTTETFYQGVRSSHSQCHYNMPTPHERVAHHTYQSLISKGQKLSMVPIDAHNLHGALHCFKNLESVVAWSHPVGRERSYIHVPSPVDLAVRAKTSLLPNIYDQALSDHLKGLEMATGLYRSLGKSTSKLLNLSLASTTRSYRLDSAEPDISDMNSSTIKDRAVLATGQAESCLAMLELDYSILDAQVNIQPESLNKFVAASQRHLASLMCLKTLRISGDPLSISSASRQVETRGFRALGSVIFPNLAHVELTYMVGREYHFVEFVDRHRMALKALEIADCAVRSNELWDDVFRGLARLELDREMNLIIRDITPAFGGAANRDNPLASSLVLMQDQLRDYVLREGPWPSLNLED